MIIYSVVCSCCFAGCMSFGEKYRCPGEKFAASKIVNSEFNHNNGQYKILSTFTEYEGGELDDDKNVDMNNRIVIIGVNVIDSNGKEQTKFVVFKGGNVAVQEYGQMISE